MNNRPRYQPPYLSERQRVVLLTFESVEAAQAWDRDGRPLDGILEAEIGDPFRRCSQFGEGHAWGAPLIEGAPCRCGDRLWHEEGSTDARV